MKEERGRGWRHNGMVPVGELRLGVEMGISVEPVAKRFQILEIEDG